MGRAGDCKDAHEFKNKRLGGRSGIRKGLRREEAEGGDLEPKGRICLQGKQRHQCVPCPNRAENRELTIGFKGWRSRDFSE